MAQFQIEGEIDDIILLTDGHIHDTYIIKTTGTITPDYLLQHKNKYVFRDVPSMMANISRVTTHLKTKITERGGDPLRETITLVPSNTGELFFIDESDEYWAMCIFIQDSRIFEKVTSSKLAFAGGKAVGIFQEMLSDFHLPLTDILPGFHNIRYRFQQWEEALKSDPAGRKGKLAREIDWIESRKTEMMEFYNLIEEGEIPRRVAHNDTKISNVLFNKQGEVLCLIDLDTVMNSTVLNDFGDAVRTYANTGEEDDLNTDKINIDLIIYEAFAKGYLEQSASFLTKTELEYLAFSARYITFEQVLRFLMDYINGDKYYKIKSPEHNLQRTYSQFKLLQGMEDNYTKMTAIIRNVLSSL